MTWNSNTKLFYRYEENSTNAWKNKPSMKANLCIDTTLKETFSFPERQMQSFTALKSLDLVPSSFICLSFFWRNGEEEKVLISVAMKENLGGHNDNGNYQARELLKYRQENVETSPAIFLIFLKGVYCKISHCHTFRML